MYLYIWYDWCNNINLHVNTVDKNNILIVYLVPGISLYMYSGFKLKLTCLRILREYADMYKKKVETKLQHKQRFGCEIWMGLPKSLFPNNDILHTMQENRLSHNL